MGWWKKEQAPGAGSRMPDFTLTTLEGEPKPLRDLLAGGPVLLAFFKASCPVCQFTLPFLERLHAGAAGDSLRVFAVSQDDAGAARAFCRQYGLSFPALLDGPGYPASNALHLAVVPTLFLVEQDGTIAWSAEGFSKKDIEAAGKRVGVNPFRPGEYVPEFQPG